MQLETEFKEPKSQYFNLACLILSLPTLIIFKVLGSCPVRVVTHPLNLPYEMTPKNRISFCLFYFIFINLFLGSCLVTQPLCHHHNVDMAAAAAMMALKKNPTRWLQRTEMSVLKFCLFYFILLTVLASSLNHGTTLSPPRHRQRTEFTVFYSLACFILSFILSSAKPPQIGNSNAFNLTQSWQEIRECTKTYKQVFVSE